MDDEYVDSDEGVGVGNGMTLRSTVIPTGIVVAVVDADDGSVGEGVLISG